MYKDPWINEMFEHVSDKLLCCYIFQYDVRGQFSREPVMHNFLEAYGSVTSIVCGVSLDDAINLQPFKEKTNIRLTGQVSGGLFHPKLFIFFYESRVRIIIGSAGLSRKNGFFMTSYTFP
jgi:hypothetical protein